MYNNRTLQEERAMRVLTKKRKKEGRTESWGTVAFERREGENESELKIEKHAESDLERMMS